MIDKAPIGYLSPAHLSVADRLLAKKFAREAVADIGFDVLAVDLIVDFGNYIHDSYGFYEALKELGGLGFSENMRKILLDAYNQNYFCVLFCEYASVNPIYEELTNEYHVFD